MKKHILLLSAWVIFFGSMNAESAPEPNGFIPFMIEPDTDTKVVALVRPKSTEELYGMVPALGSDKNIEMFLTDQGYGIADKPVVLNEIIIKKVSVSRKDEQGVKTIAFIQVPLKDILPITSSYDVKRFVLKDLISGLSGDPVLKEQVQDVDGSLKEFFERFEGVVLEDRSSLGGQQEASEGQIVPSQESLQEPSGVESLTSSSDIAQQVPVIENLQDVAPVVIPVQAVQLPAMPALQSDSSQELPPGSYALSCNACEVKNGTLTCQCRTIKGDMVPASLDINQRKESEQIVNCNGVLKAMKPGAFCEDVVLPQELPAGSYKNSCVDCKMEGTTLRCKCRTLRGGLIDAALDTSTRLSEDEIVNCDGTLKMMSPGKRCPDIIVPKDIPDGSYKKSCTDCRMIDNMLHCKCRKVDGTVTDTSLDETARKQSDEIANCNGMLTVVSKGSACPVR